MSEPTRIALLFRQLVKQPQRPFPEFRGKLDAPNQPGVYIIRDRKGCVVYVGRTHSQGGLHQRLRGHLSGRSVFARNLPNGPNSLRTGYCFQCLPVTDHRSRALLEHVTVGRLCPEHLGLGLRA